MTVDVSVGAIGPCSTPDRTLASELLDLARFKPPWHALAQCRGVDVDFFPGPGQPTEPAKAVCVGCQVMTECAEAAHAGREVGVWAGLSEVQRRRLRSSTRLRRETTGR